MSTYSFNKTVTLTYDEAVKKLKAELKEEGFGVLTEIDVKATIKKKLDKDFKKYVILGACNPGFAYEALNMEDELGLLLPCNVIVFEKKSGEVVVSAVNPEKALKIADNASLEKVAGQVSEHLKGVIDKV
jgi:uncharacterized protein (DUF302 family)